MWKPWTWGVGSNERAIGNARASATDLARRRVERDEVEIFLARHRDLPAGVRRPA